MQFAPSQSEALIGRSRSWSALKAFLSLLIVAVLLALPSVAHAASINTPLTPPGLSPAGNSTQYAAQTSCLSLGNCLVGGLYIDANSVQQSFVQSEYNGTWQPAQDIPGLNALNSGTGGSQVYGVSCSTPDNCVAVGSYSDANTHTQAYVALEVNGVWQEATIAPGVGAAEDVLQPTTDPGYSTAFSVSCSSDGTCTTGGYVTNNVGVQSAFAMSEDNGVWQPLQVIDGAAPFVASHATITQISCTSAGNCSAAGNFPDANGFEIFYVTEVNGVWGSAVVPTGTLSTPLSLGNASVNTLLCNSPGNCFADGYYSGAPQFWTNEVNGVWDTNPTTVPGVALGVTPDPSAGQMTVDSYTCTSVNNCVVAGSYTDVAGVQAMVDDEVNGVWQTIPFLDAINSINEGSGGPGEGYADMTTVTCTSQGNCWAGGFYTDLHDVSQAFVVQEISGVWQTATPDAQINSVNTGQNGPYTGDASVYDITCDSNAVCTAGGFYTDANGEQDFTQSLPLATPRIAQDSLTIAPLNGSTLTDQPLTLSATGGTTGGAISYGVQSQGTSGCMIDGNVLSAPYAGTCLVYATEAGNSTYLPVQSQIATISILPGAPPAVALTVSGLSLSASKYLSTGTVSAAWFASPGATTYTCTLLYGYDTASTFTVTTSVPDCDFSGLLLDTSYGIEVTANASTGSSASVTQFVKTPPAATTTIFCHKRSHIVKRTGTAPVCPKGYARGR